MRIDQIICCDSQIRESTEFRNRFKAPDTTAKFKVIYKILEMRESGAKTANEVDGEMALFFFAVSNDSHATTQQSTYQGAVTDQTNKTENLV